MTLRRHLPLALALTVGMTACWAASLPPAVAEELVALPMDDAGHLGTVISSDPSSKTAGEASIRISTAWPTLVNLAELPVSGIEAATLVYEADLRSDSLEGNAYLEMWCLFPDGGQYFSRGLDSVVGGTADWRTLRTSFFLEEGQRPEKLTLNVVINGRGTVWIDNLRVRKEPLP
ncbi:MAG: hypothetical protein V3V17_06235 [Alphaproteobacteria bacterium]